MPAEEKKTKESCRTEHPACQQGFPAQPREEVRGEWIRAGGRSQLLTSFIWGKQSTGKEHRGCKEREKLSLTPKLAIPSPLPHHTSVHSLPDSTERLKMLKGHTKIHKSTLNEALEVNTHHSAQTPLQHISSLQRAPTASG